MPSRELCLSWFANDDVILPGTSIVMSQLKLGHLISVVYFCKSSELELKKCVLRFCFYVTAITN